MDRLRKLSLPVLDPDCYIRRVRVILRLTKAIRDRLIRSYIRKVRIITRCSLTTSIKELLNTHSLPETTLTPCNSEQHSQTLKMPINNPTKIITGTSNKSKTNDRNSSHQPATIESQLTLRFKICQPRKSSPNSSRQLQDPLIPVCSKTKTTTIPPLTLNLTRHKCLIQENLCSMATKWPTNHRIKTDKCVLEQSILHTLTLT